MAQRTKQVLTYIYIYRNRIYIESIYIESIAVAIRHYGDTEMYSSLQAVKNRLFDLYWEFIKTF